MSAVGNCQRATDLWVPASTHGKVDRHQEQAHMNKYNIELKIIQLIGGSARDGR
jgi:hypothetical protein